MENEWVLWSLFIPYSPSSPPLHHPHPSHHHCSSELRKSPDRCPCSHLAYLQPVPSTGSRINLKSLIQIKHSSQKPPVASQRIKSQILSRIFIDFLWPDLVTDCCPGSFCSGHLGSLLFLMIDWDTPTTEPSHRLFLLLRCYSLRCWQGSFFHFRKVPAKTAPQQGDHPWHPAPLLALPFLSSTFISLTGIQDKL